MPGRREELCGMFWNMFTCWNSTLCQHPQLGPDKITWPERIDVSSLLVSLNLYCVVSSDFVKLFFVWRMHYRDVLMSLSYQWPEREVGSHITEQKELFIRYNFVLTLSNKVQMVNISLSLYLGIKKNKQKKQLTTILQHSLICVNVNKLLFNVNSSFFYTLANVNYYNNMLKI